ncbi:MAG: hypothetical protein A2Z83_01155 [Omnitrophica bacterium GWA2_52_8]|nr:MAG: hypothetical protein A2Z83_01155 [Omnitrophica bacterium GWA2_52_8]
MIHKIIVSCLTVQLIWLQGCSGTKKFQTGSNAQSLEAAKIYLDQEQYYQARKIAKEILKQDPGNREAEKLMALVLDREIARHKAVFGDRLPADLNDQEREGQAKTWLERSELLMQLGQYNRAVEAAENVFLYDPNNRRASEILDRLRGKFTDSIDKQKEISREAAREEIYVRVRQYREQALLAMQQKQWGVARMSVRKIQLLIPDDPEARKLEEEIKAQEKLQT